ncbi:uncharacterized protein LOC144949695 isoform X1 [Lampetra fluviatilis]
MAATSSQETNSDDEFEVEAILDWRVRRGRAEYLVKWSGYGAEENTWEPPENLANCPELLSNFRARTPQLSSPVRGRHGTPQGTPRRRPQLPGSPPGSPTARPPIKELPGKQVEQEAELNHAGDPSAAVDTRTHNGTQEDSCEDGGVTQDEMAQEDRAQAVPAQDSDIDADVEDESSRLLDASGLQRTSSRRRRRMKPVRQDTTESEDDASAVVKRPRWSLRLSPHREGRLSAEESTSRVRPLCVAHPGTADACDGPSEAQGADKVAAAESSHAVGGRRKRWALPAACTVGIALLLLLVVYGVLQRDG